MAIKRQDSFLLKAAKAVHEHPYLFRAVMGSAALVTGAVTGGLGAAAVGIAWVVAENTVAAVVAKEIEDSKKESEKEDDVIEGKPQKADESKTESKILADKKNKIKETLGDKGENNESKETTKFREQVSQEHQQTQENQR